MMDLEMMQNGSQVCVPACGLTARLHPSVHHKKKTFFSFEGGRGLPIVLLMITTKNNWVPNKFNICLFSHHNTRSEFISIL